MAAVTTLPATFVAGNILTAAQMNDLRGAFRVLQVVNATYAVSTANATSTYADTGLTATITPSATSSKVLVFVSQAGCGKESSNTAVALRLMRGATAIATFEAYGAFDNTVGINYVGTCGTTYLDSPATTSATTYKTQLQSISNTANAIVQGNGGTSTITLMEISA